MTVRDALPSDIPRMVEMGARFAALAYPEIDYDHDDFAATLESLLEDDRAIILVSDGGMFVGLCYSMWFNRDHVTFQELAWWSESGDGLELFKAAEERAAEIADTIMMSSVTTMRSDVLTALYRRRGYRWSDCTYLKGL